MSKLKRIQKNKEVYITLVGVFVIVTAMFMFIAFTSYLFHFKEDQSQLGDIWSRDITVQNIMGKLGNELGNFFIFKSLGLSAYCIPFFLFLFGVKLLFKVELVKIWKSLSHSLFFIIWLPIAFGFVFPTKYLFSGILGLEMSKYLQTIVGSVGMVLVLLFALILYFVLEFQLTVPKIKALLRKKKMQVDDIHLGTKSLLEEDNQSETDQIIQSKYTHKKELEPSSVEVSESISTEQVPTQETNQNAEQEPHSFIIEKPLEEKPEMEEDKGPELKVVDTPQEEITDDEVGNDILAKNGPYDPRLDLSQFKFPTLDLLKKYDNEESITVNNAELEENKNKIVETLGNYGIGISQIKATIGPTVTLYEIIPDKGVRISKIKNLEDDIALSLAALGIRIIAPIPGKGTIGIEVPNSSPTIVSMRSVLQSNKFKSSEMELPIAFGKTISNESFVADLAKMPHLLMAGATGQGKSVGINAVITSLLYKKHPSELKFVFVDPKKVELTLYNKIERHYLAKLPNSDEPIITDNTKVIHTLNSLCIEMDDRYELLKNAMVRNIKEYNEKFINRKLNPENGHTYLPYIVLVVDEFADLIMTAGKEVETPIARLAQLARAVGIHLIIATQRPSVNVITGIIKANFPARLAFRVTSKIDSRTILDGPGADQLIGKGDMLLTTGSNMIRLQCAFVDTPEVERIVEYIGSQRGYPDSYLLPEFVGEEGGSDDFDSSEKDDLFEEAARVVVSAQQGSTSLIQRKLSLGYNRAGRIMDQLEASGIVGPFNGSKARDVMFPDIISLEQFLKTLE